MLRALDLPLICAALQRNAGRCKRRQTAAKKL
jgi:hypothetical protein